MATKPDKKVRKMPGKRVGGFLYIHRTALDLVGATERAVVREAALLATDAGWNVAKVSGRDVSLLHYEDFDAAAFPALLESWKIDLASGLVAWRDYSDWVSPPILHRKETLLPPDDPRIPRFAALTKQAEEHGLFENRKSIGTRGRWLSLIESKGLVLQGHAILRPGERAFAVQRYRTAIVRRDLSQPVALMRRLGIVTRETSVFDYGCGQGDDVAALVENGYEAFGWDPYYAPNGPRCEADAVNLGFVVNAIEDSHERWETVRAAWGFARRAMVVSAMVVGKVPLAGLRSHKDGYLTSRGTFQKYFTQDELRDLIAGATGEAAVSLAPGIVAVFRDKELEQEVVYRRRSRATQISDRFVRPDRPIRVRTRAAAPPVRERIAAELEAIWRTALDLGRMPGPTEVPVEVLEGLSAARVSLDRAVATCRAEFGASLLEEASMARRDDLLVHFALTLFPGAPRYASLPRTLRRDVRTFFGNHSTVLAEANKLLFSLRNAELIEAMIVDAVASGLGARIKKDFRFRSDALARLPAGLRVLVGCAEVIHSDLSAYDFIDIDPAEGKISALRCDDLQRPIPRIVEIIGVNLKTLRRQRNRPVGDLLYLKSRYMPMDDPRRSAQAILDEKLLKLKIVDAEGVGPSADKLSSILTIGSLVQKGKL